MLVFPLLLLATVLTAQKKPLDHTVYDGWQSIGEKYISNDGKFVVYTITPQEGDALLVIQQTDGKKLLELQRGYAATISEDNRYVFCKIKPAYQQTRDAKIKKKKADDMPKDSLAVINMASMQVEKFAKVKSFKLPEKSSVWLAWQYEKPAADTTKKKDSTVKAAAAGDGLFADAEETGNGGDKKEEGTLLMLRNLVTNTTDSFTAVTEYLFDEHGTKLLLESSGSKKDSVKPSVIVYSLDAAVKDTILYNFNDAKAYAWDTLGKQLAFVAERDSSAKALQKFYKLYYYTAGNDSAKIIADRFTAGLPANYAISENADIHFSASGKRLLIGTAPILPPKDTTLPEFERVNVDVWNYRDDDLMTVQLKNLDKDLKKNYLAVWDVATQQLTQLGDENFRLVRETLEGDGNIFYTATDTGHRVERQWQGYTFSDIYAVNPATGARKLITKKFKGNTYASYTGKYLLLYDDIKRGYSVYNGITGQFYKVAADIKYPLYDEENDVPDDPNAYGIAKWMEDDKYVLIYDRYNVWKVDPEGKEKSIPLFDELFTRYKLERRYLTTDKNEKFIDGKKELCFKFFLEADKTNYVAVGTLSNNGQMVEFVTMASGPAINSFLKAKNAGVYVYSKESYQKSPDLFVTSREIDSLLRLTAPPIPGDYGRDVLATQLSHLNPQQSQYYWGTSELFKWKAYTGKLTEGVLYKPEDFDSTKKYPMIVYFYERNNQTLNNYIAPAPTPSRLNIPFFVSRGYVVFVPDIWYTTGHPGKSAYDYIVSGTRALIKKGFIDSARIGLQGQSWGGYQTAYLITQTNLYKAAWAGAPVSNMFSAYGGIRWESGYNRQMQYEKQQSRIGSTIWEKPQLYIENSPLFHLPKVKTPLVIMSNDADGAVPWYQGIELFTAMRRLNKPVWMLNYNNEAHNLVERKNRKDIQIREQQFFDWLLKDAPAPKWITDGVPAVMKGR